MLSVFYQIQFSFDSETEKAIKHFFRFKKKYFVSFKNLEFIKLFLV